MQVEADYALVPLSADLIGGTAWWGWGVWACVDSGALPGSCQCHQVFPATEWTILRSQTAAVEFAIGGQVNLTGHAVEGHPRPFVYGVYETLGSYDNFGWSRGGA